MVLKIVLLILGALALIINFRAKWVLETLFKQDEPSLEMLLKVKYSALALAVLIFIAAFALVR